MPRKSIEEEFDGLRKQEKSLVAKELHDLHKAWGLTHEDFRQILGAEIFSVTGGVLAGLFLALYMKNALLVPALFIAFPGFLEMRGSIGGSLSARLSSALFLGFLKPTLRNQRILRGNIVAAFSLSILVGLALGVVAYALELIVFGVSFPQIISIMVLAGALSNAIEIPVIVASVFALYRRGVDPDNVMGPYITTLGDVVSIVSILVAIAVMA